MKSRKKQVLSFGVFALALNLIPLTAIAQSQPPQGHPHGTPPPAPSQAPAAPAVSYFQGQDDLTYAEFQSVFRGKPAVQISDSDSDTVVLHGLVFDDCSSFFKVQSSYANQQAGFEITDPLGKGRACMAVHKTNRDVCNSITPCKNIGAGQDIALNDEHVSIGWFALNQDSGDGVTPQFSCGGKDSDPSGCIAIHQSSDEIQSARAAAALDKVCDDIRNEDFTSAKSDLQRYKMIHFDKDQVDSILAQIDAGTLTSVEECIKSSNADSLQACNDSLDTYAQAHAKDKAVMDKVGMVYENLAKKYDSGKDPSYQDRSTAIDVLNNAEAMKGMSAKHIAEMDALIKLIKLERLNRLAQDGPSKQLSKDYQAEMKDLAADAQSACRGNGAQTQDCADALQAMQAVQAGVTQQVQQAEAGQQQIATSLSKALSGIGQPGSTSTGQQNVQGLNQQQMYGRSGLLGQGYGSVTGMPQSSTGIMNVFGAQQLQ